MTDSSNPYQMPHRLTAGEHVSSACHPWLVCTAILGLAISGLMVYGFFNYPIVRPPDWQHETAFRILVNIAKWGSAAVIFSSSILFCRSKRTATDIGLFCLSLAPAVTVIGMYLFWVFVFA